MFCPNCGQDCGDVAFCANCGAQVAESQAAPETTDTSSGFAPENFTPEAPGGKKFSKKLIAIPVIAILLVVAIVLGSVAVGFANSPQAKIANGINKLLFQTESFDFDAEYVYEYKSSSSDYYGYSEGYSRTMKITATGALAWGKDLASSSYFADVTTSEDYSGGDNYTTDFSVVSSKGETLIYSEELPAGISFNTPNAYEYAKANLEDVADELLYEDLDDIEDALDDEFGLNIETITGWIEDIVSGNKINEKVLAEVYDDYARTMVEENLDIDAKDIPDYSTLKKVITKFVAKGISEEAFEVKDKFKEDGITKYDVKIKFDVLAEDLYNYIKECKELEDLLDTDEGEEFMEEFEEAIDNEYYEDEELEFIAGISKGCLAYFEYTQEENWDGTEYKTVVKVTLSNFNKNANFSGKYNEVLEKLDDDEWFKIEDLDDVEDFYDEF